MKMKKPHPIPHAELGGAGVLLLERVWFKAAEPDHVGARPRLFPLMVRCSYHERGASAALRRPGLIAGAPGLGSLKTLILGSGKFTPKGLEALAKSKALSALETLKFYSDRDVRVMCRAALAA